MYTCEQNRHSALRVFKECEFFDVAIKGHQTGLWAPRINIAQVCKWRCLSLKIGIRKCGWKRLQNLEQHLGKMGFG